jgi:hypothetical protein
VAGEHPTGTDGDVPGSRNRRVVGAVALVALAVGIAVLLTPFGGEPSDDAAVATTVDTGVAVRFEAADVAGDDPFTPSVTNDVVPTVRAIARETAAATVAELPTAGAAGPPSPPVTPPDSTEVTPRHRCSATRWSSRSAWLRNPMLAALPRRSWLWTRTSSRPTSTAPPRSC